MEISLMAPTNVQVSNHIPDDTAFSILSKLPIKSLKRFECVCKSWSLLFDNPHFMTMYRNNLLSKDHSYYHDTSMLLNLTSGQEHVLYSLSSERFENRVKIDWPKIEEDDPLPIQQDDDDSPFQEGDDDLDENDPPYDSDEDDPIPFQEDDDDPVPFQEDDGSSFEILGSASINGILCLRSLPYYNEKLILWNPTTNKFKVIHVSDGWFGSHIHHRFGYDNVKDDFKVIRFTTCISFGIPNSLASFWEIYSLRSNSWRKLDIDMAPPYSSTLEVYMDGVSHWLDKRRTHTYLLSFDFSNESFITTTIPSDIDDSSDSFLVWKNLVLLNGSIALILTYEETSTFHISILGELGVKESWTKLFIVGPLPCLMNPIGAGKNGIILFVKKDGELAWFDLSSGMIDEIEIGVTPERCVILFHKESFLPIG